MYTKSVLESIKSESKINNPKLKVAKRRTKVNKVLVFFVF
ncbi:hypothetical protein MmmBen181_0225 [Mycoplasma mycoides subsp. mycoides]|nr:hypothetical protein MmmBen_0217 [Mycoplasma mycoides subsp. mycoides]AME11418.1 hypothetical protein MmmBen50_0217 [Mycoplasma mycoides subsp. mycoides]AME12439.1 hypothetical protein MmmBen181_0225 [Mycoplasma mycoides subsp. mycoides]AME13476.1 hypothetical protein MmmBen326_0218 [Mycoplasma mycoides subsp. mycoides]AME14466.1 hypothetical protein MmmBen468_0225 [Mycoplasma mycoides subsp. mycoides]